MNAPEKIAALTPKARFLADNLREGEQYAGIIIGKNGEQDYHVFLLPGEATGVTHQQALDWAKKQGGELPTRREQSLLIANLKEHFQPAWYWSGERHASASGYAWLQSFNAGSQDDWLRGDQLRARAVRRLPI